MTNKGAKNVEPFGGWKKLLILPFPLCICINVLTYMHYKHSCRELWAQWEQSPVYCYKAGLKQWSEKILQDLKWKHRMDASRIAVGFMPYYTGALILTAFLLRLEMKAACGEGAVLHYLSLSAVWGFCSSTRQPPAELCALPAPWRWGGLGTGRGCGWQPGYGNPCPVKLQKQQSVSGFVFLGWSTQGTFSCKTAKLVISVYYV